MGKVASTAIVEGQELSDDDLDQVAGGKRLQTDGIGVARGRVRADDFDAPAADGVGVVRAEIAVNGGDRQCALGLVLRDLRFHRVQRTMFGQC